MTRPVPVPVRMAVLAGVTLLALAGCGRRGPLEPPPDAAATSPAQPAATAPAPAKPARALPADRRLRPTTSSGVASSRTTLATDPGAVVEDTPDDDEEDDTQTALTVSPSPTPKKRIRPFAVPNQPFVLDPLL